MGACVSRPENCVGFKSGSSRKKISRKRRRFLKKRASAYMSDRSSEKLPSLPADRPLNNPPFNGSSLSLSVLCMPASRFFCLVMW